MLDLHFSNAESFSSQWPQSFYIRIYISRTVTLSVVDPDPDLFGQVGYGFGIIIPDPDPDLTFLNHFYKEICINFAHSSLKRSNLSLFP
jgi:hypothetical protein